MKEYNFMTIIKTLIGHTNSHAETNYDTESLKNLKDFEECFYNIIDIIGEEISKTKNSIAYSVVEIRNQKIKMLKTAKMLIEEYLEID